MSRQVKRGLGLAALALPLLAASWAVGAINIPLSYERIPEKKGAPFFASGYERLPLALQAPGSGWKLPAFTSARPLFAVVRLGDSRFLVVLDQAETNSEYYSRMFFDANTNQDLTDDPVLSLETNRLSSSGYQTVFPNVDCRFQLAGREFPYCFRPSFNLWQRPEPEDDDDPDGAFLNNCQFSLQVRCRYVGQLDLGGASHQVVLCDDTGNGRFDDRLRYVPETDEAGARLEDGDRIFISDAKRAFARDGQDLGRYLFIKDQLYEVAIDHAERLMTLVPVTDNAGSLRLAQETERLTLYELEQGSAVMLYKPGLRAQVPWGRYRLRDYDLVRQDAQTNLWMLTGRGTNESTAVTVADDTDAALNFGEPFRASVALTEWMLRNWQYGRRDELRLDLELFGAGGEEVCDIQHIRGKNSPHKQSARRRGYPLEAAYVIKKPDGELVAKGNFEYG